VKLAKFFICYCDVIQACIFAGDDECRIDACRNRNIP